MSNDIIPFADTQKHVEKIFSEWDSWPKEAPKLYVVRDLYGRIRIVLSEDSKDKVKKSTKYRNCLKHITNNLYENLGPRAYRSKDSVLYVPAYLLDEPGHAIHKICRHTNVFLVERLVAGHSWWTVKKGTSWIGQAKRYVLYSAKGGVGRSTTAAILAWNLARLRERAGEFGEDVLPERVMVVDLDLESPGLSSGMLATKDQPEFGIVDWFVEDLVEQGDKVIEQMTATPSWSRDFPGEVYVIPAHGREPEEFLAKLGRTYLHTVDKESGKGVAWASRLGRLLSRLEEKHKPTIVLLESRSGLSDIAASAVTDFNARVLLFAIDSESTWENYQILFSLWRDKGLAKKIRERLSVVSALTPEVNTDLYLEGFRQRAWELFLCLYDADDPTKNSGDNYTFDVNDDFAPHMPMSIGWTRGLSSGVSLRDLEQSKTSISSAYEDFQKKFDKLVKIDRLPKKADKPAQDHDEEPSQ